MRSFVHLCLWNLALGSGTCSACLLWAQIMLYHVHTIRDPMGVLTTA